VFGVGKIDCRHGSKAKRVTLSTVWADNPTVAVRLENVVRFPCKWSVAAMDADVFVVAGTASVASPRRQKKSRPLKGGSSLPSRAGLGPRKCP
jgi:hypothetical protein